MSSIRDFELPVTRIARSRRNFRPSDLLESLRHAGKTSGCMILHSPRGGRHTIVATGPILNLQWRAGVADLSIGNEAATATFPVRARELLDWLPGSLLALDLDLPRLPGFGWIGYLSYDFVRAIEEIPQLSVDDSRFPDAEFRLFQQYLIFDHVEGTIEQINLNEGRERESGSPRVDRDLPGESDSYEWTPTADENRFADMVVKALEYIGAGDTFQVNLSTRFDRSFSGEPFDLFRRLVEVNPSPYMAYIDCGVRSIVSGSPEQLFSISNGLVSSRPIAGTRKRGRNQEETDRLVQELLSSEKERAEHLMLVDLARNDIGRIAGYGSVHVDEFMAIEHYSHVTHIVSNVTGRLAAGRQFSDVVCSMFPGGTITGAPKIRSMEIIEELEPTRRGIYTGSIGWVGPAGDAEFNIAIRTLVIENGRISCQAGAGIVADSVPKHEFKESLKKARAGMAAVDSLS